jgi:hypothetical protein
MRGVGLIVLAVVAGIVYFMQSYSQPVAPIWQEGFFAPIFDPFNPDDYVLYSTYAGALNSCSGRIGYTVIGNDFDGYRCVPMQGAP